MGKKLVLLLAFGFCVIIAIAFIGTVIFSVINISYQIGETEVTPAIERTQLIPIPLYEGYLIVSTHVELQNGGFYDITDLKVNITVFADNWEISSSLDGKQIGQGNNVIGTIQGQNSWTGAIDVNITNYIPQLAIEDCTLRIFINIHLIYQPIVSIPFDYNSDAIEIAYDAPFSPV